VKRDVTANSKTQLEPPHDLRMENCFQLECLREHETDSFPIKIHKDQLVCDLQSAIKAALTDWNPATSVATIAPRFLELYQVDIEPGDKRALKSNFEAINNNRSHPPRLYGAQELSMHFGGNPPKAGNIHILIRISRRESRDPQPCGRHVADAPRLSLLSLPHRPTSTLTSSVCFILGPLTYPFAAATRTTLPSNPVQLFSSSPKRNDRNIEQDVSEFANELRAMFDTYLRGNVQLPVWQPSPDLADETRKHITALKIPIICPSSEYPLLLLHELGHSSHDAQLVNRINRLFHLDSK